MYRYILLPVLLDEDHRPDKAIRVAKALAAEDAKFTILHVMETVPGYAASYIPADLLENSRAEVEKALAATVEELPGAENALVSGHAGRAIVDFAKGHEVDCIVMASHRPGIGNYLIGSTADRVVRHASCSVHVIR